MPRKLWVPFGIDGQHGIEYDKSLKLNGDDYAKWLDQQAKVTNRDLLNSATENQKYGVRKGVLVASAICAGLGIVTFVAAMLIEQHQLNKEQECVLKRHNL